MAFHRRPSPSRTDAHLEWLVLGDRRHIPTAHPVTGLPMGLCGATAQATATVEAEAGALDLPECDGCWEQMEFLRWA